MNFINIRSQIIISAMCMRTVHYLLAVDMRRSMPTRVARGMPYFVLIIIAILTTAGCMVRDPIYQPMQSGEGYEEAEVAPNEFVIHVRGTSGASGQVVESFFSRRARQLCGGNNYTRHYYPGQGLPGKNETGSLPAGKDPAIVSFLPSGGISYSPGGGHNYTPEVTRLVKCGKRKS